MNTTSRPDQTTAASANTPFRFYDNRQKYLAFVNTCNEKQKVADRAADELRQIRPTPPALRLFDAGMGDATVLARLMRSAHATWPAVPQLVVAKEISREDVRLGLEKMPDRFLEHPTTVLVITNLHYADAPVLRPRNPEDATRLNWQVLRLQGNSSHEYARQIDALAPVLDHGWATRPSEKSGNPGYVRPSVLVIYREDHAFLLDSVIPRQETPADRLRLHPRLATLACAHVGAVQGGQGAAAAGAAARARRPAAGDPVARRRPGTRDRAQRCGPTNRRSRWTATS